jgi:hypothetical protein
MAQHQRRDKVPAQRDFVAECGGEQMGVGVASDIAQQGLVIDVAAS